jgi:hypothetical protein
LIGSHAVKPNLPVVRPPNCTLNLHDDATVVGATVVGATVVGATVVGATVVGATVVGATVVGATVVGATVVGATVVGVTVVGVTVVGATVVGATVVADGSAVAAVVEGDGPDTVVVTSPGSAAFFVRGAADVSAPDEPSDEPHAATVNTVTSRKGAVRFFI